jgi:hypothetical protein
MMIFPMSNVDLERVQGRGGLLSCACDPLLAPLSDQDGPQTRWPLAVFTLSNALNIFAQALVLTIVPLGGAILFAGPSVALPFAALLAGAAIGTIPAAWLTGMDQRWGFALGGSFGVGGAVLAAFGMVSGLSSAFALGSFWLGLAQGFGNFYRHGAAGLARRDGRSIALVIGAGALAAFVVPSALSLANSSAGPLATAAALVMAATAHLLASALAFLLPRQRGFAPIAEAIKGDTPFVFATLYAALSWFAMALMMGLAPSLMIGCGIGVSQTSGIVGWHILAMYAPALLLGLVIRPARAKFICLLGVACSASALWLAFHVTSEAGFTLAMVLSGFGWSGTTLAATTLLHARSTPSRAQLAVHDFLLLAAALTGAGAVALHSFV